MESISALHQAYLTLVVMGLGLLLMAQRITLAQAGRRLALLALTPVAVAVALGVAGDAWATLGPTERAVLVLGGALTVAVGLPLLLLRRTSGGGFWHHVAAGVVAHGLYDTLRGTGPAGCLRAVLMAGVFVFALLIVFLTAVFAAA